MKIKRKINYTGRQRINRSEVRIRLEERPGAVPRFTAHLELSRLKLPDNARVYVEAYYRNSTQRFDFGTVGKLEHPADTSLSEVDLDGSPLFRVKVVDTVNGRAVLLASAERLAALDDDEDKACDALLIVKTRDLGQLTWKTEIRPDNKPVLVLNNRIPDALGKIKSDPLFQGLVLPGALREVLTAIAWDEGSDEGDDEGSWKRQWLEFGEKISSTPYPDDTDPAEIRDWIGDVAMTFATKHELSARITALPQEAG
ncbi:MAG: hypothetical protein NNA22_10925 [Nitrospira sp.]|nr:hypothetical protein [Nitrospira sp.]